MLGEIGLETEFDEVYPSRPNVYGRLRGTEGARTLILNGHLDVVPAGEGWSTDPYGAYLSGDNLFGRGAADMKGGLAAMVLAAKLIRRLDIDLKGDLLITAVADEEVSETGTKHYLRTRSRKPGDFAIVGEPTDLKLCVAQKGQLMYKITVRGRAAHSSRPQEGLNAISKMGKIIHALEEYSETLPRRKHNLLGSPTVSIGTIIGGTSTSIVPDSCTIRIDRRTLPNESVQSVDEELRQIIDNLTINDNELHVDIGRYFTEDASEVDERSEIVLKLQQACKLLLGFGPSICGFEATSDAGDLCESMPTIMFGPGSLSQAHRPEEFVSIRQVIDAALVYAGTALLLLT
jgi:acetylornithine deacetylase/succinyl-diaminopimelate desuccinylase family protein